LDEEEQVDDGAGGRMGEESMKTNVMIDFE
jgi:hypothetical protein